MARCVEMQYLPGNQDRAVPAQCDNPTLRDVVVSRAALSGFDDDFALTLDVYHFHNCKTDEYVTVCLSKDVIDSDGHKYVLLTKERILSSDEDVDKMKS